jgi:CelD/BcsL family acetyltransferase involved in cellulose biosynthesis
MQRLDRAEFASAAADYDRAVAADPAIDAFCSRSAWILSFAEAFRPDAPLVFARAGDAFVALAEVDEPGMGSVLEPLESMWGFASPLVGAGCAALLEALLAELALGAARPLLLSGIPISRARLDPLLRALAARYALRPLAPTQRYQASLAGGFDGWLSRRARGFRRNLRIARARTREADVTFEEIRPFDSAQAAAVYARALAIERDTWKTASGNGVDHGPMRDFYARMLPRLAERGELRALFANRDGVDLGYLYGGVVGGLFRGLQFSFREDARALGLGNVLQAEMLERLCAEGIDCYDLGAQSSYKRHWGEEGLVTIGLLARPR